jgi:hypothetical protein
VRRCGADILGNLEGQEVTYSEASFFDRAHFAHIAARDEHLRLQRIHREQAALRARSPMRAKREQAGLVGLGLFEPTLTLI